MEDRPSIRAIQVTVSGQTGVTLLEMISGRRDIDVVDARHAAIWLARRASYTDSEIARAFDRDRTTVRSAVLRVARLMHTDRIFARHMMTLTTMAGGMGTPLEIRGGEL